MPVKSCSISLRVGIYCLANDCFVISFRLLCFNFLVSFGLLKIQAWHEFTVLAFDSWRRLESVDILSFATCDVRSCWLPDGFHSALASGGVGASALPGRGAAVYSALCPLGDPAVAGGVGFDAGWGALWHLARQRLGVRWGLPGGCGGVPAGAFGLARLGPAPVGAVPQVAGGRADRQQGGAAVGAADAPLARLSLFPAQLGLWPQ